MNNYRQVSPDLPQELDQAGQLVDRAIKHMLDHGLNPIAAASSLLGGALGVLARSHTDDEIVAILERAVANVRAGSLAQSRTDVSGGSNGRSGDA